MRRWVLLLVGFVPLWSSPAAAQVIVHTVAITTNSSGDVTVYTPSTFGLVRALRYVPDGTSPLDNGADLTITDNVTGHGILAVTNIGPSARDWPPRAYTVSTTGVNAVYAAAGESVMTEVAIGAAIKIVVAQGGNAK